MIKLKIISKFYIFASANQTVLFWLWPIFKNIAPILTGFLTFGQILEIDSGVIPFKYWVASGLISWIFLSASLTTGGYVLSSRVRRRRFELSNLSAFEIFLANMIPHVVLAAIFGMICVYYLISSYSPLQAFCRTLLITIFIVFCLLLSLSIALHIGILASISRDVKHILPWISTLLLFTSPVFYLPRNPNSALEKFIQELNPLNYLLSLSRTLLFDNEFKITVQLLLFFTIAIVSTLLTTLKMTEIVSRLAHSMSANVDEENYD